MHVAQWHVLLCSLLFQCIGTVSCNKVVMQGESAYSHLQGAGARGQTPPPGGVAADDAHAVALIEDGRRGTPAGRRHERAGAVRQSRGALRELRHAGAGREHRPLAARATGRQRRVPAAGAADARAEGDSCKHISYASGPGRAKMLLRNLTSV